MNRIRRIQPEDLTEASRHIAALMDLLARNTRSALDGPPPSETLDSLVDDGPASPAESSEGGVMYGSYDDSGTLVHAVVAMPQPGRTAMIFTARPSKRKLLPDLARVIETACGAMTPDQATLAQALIDPDDDLRRDALAAAGFTELSTLCYMQKRLGHHAAPPPQQIDGISFEPWRPQAKQDYLHVLEASYQQTLDCPGLAGIRRTEDVLAGHRGAGEFDPSLWTLMRLHDEPIGVLLLNPVPAADCVELVYLGLAHHVRGRGYGALLMQRGMWLCAERPETYFTLAVDETNTPALALYRRFGLRRVTRKLAMIRRLNAPTSM
ncbi:GNAT family N-acetyltransferase [Planctomycetales bacterium ZRK34]|nr:GNAT family N-acetyltransferase [Planctomycetales bacterium ZRK34]